MLLAMLLAFLPRPPSPLAPSRAPALLRRGAPWNWTRDAAPDGSGYGRHDPARHDVRRRGSTRYNGCKGFDGRHHGNSGRNGRSDTVDCAVRNPKAAATNAAALALMVHWKAEPSTLLTDVDRGTMATTSSGTGVAIQVCVRLAAPFVRLGLRRTDRGGQTAGADAITRSRHGCRLRPTCTSLRRS